MDWTLRPLGSTGLSMTPLTIGGAPLGSMPTTFGYDVAEEDGIATAVAALTGPINSLDTAGAYSDGESERRIGEALRRVGGLPDGYVLATKLTRDLATGDFSGERLRRAITESLDRLGLDRVPLLYLHDPENTTFADATAPDGPVEVIRGLKDEGIAGAIGVAGGDTATIAEYVSTGHFDVLLTHNRWSLVNRTAGPLIDQAVELGMGVVNAAPFGGGILAGRTAGSTRYGYREAPAELLAAIERIRAICDEAEVPLAAAAVQFSLRDPRIASTVIGVSRPSRIEEGVANATLDIPDGVFDAIDQIVTHLPVGTGPK